MLAKLTATNQVVLPQSVTQAIGLVNSLRSRFKTVTLF